MQSIEVVMIEKQIFQGSVPQQVRYRITLLSVYASVCPSVHLSDGLYFCSVVVGLSVFVYF